MPIKVKSRKMLWGRSGNRCAFPDCQRELVVAGTETDDASVIGIECHIVARASDGPRGDSPLDGDQREQYDNRILLCGDHHTLVDSRPDRYTVEQLKSMKREHETWVSTSLEGFDAQRQRDEEVYAGYIEDWAERAGIEQWTGWSSFVLGSWEPEMERSLHSRLRDLGPWLLARIWPGRYPDLEVAFSNFMRVLQDFLNTFDRHAAESEHDENTLATKRFYRIEEWNPGLYHRLADEYDFHVALVYDLMCELTRAANLVCDKVREHISPSFRLREGALLVMSGPHECFEWTQYRLEYAEHERTERPYPGIEEFKAHRENRDVHFGGGTSPDYASS